MKKKNIFRRQFFFLQFLFCFGGCRSIKSIYAKARKKAVLRKTFHFPFSAGTKKKIFDGVCGRFIDNFLWLFLVRFIDKIKVRKLNKAVIFVPVDKINGARVV